MSVFKQHNDITWFSVWNTTLLQKVDYNTPNSVTIASYSEWS